MEHDVAAMASQLADLDRKVKNVEAARERGDKANTKEEEELEATLSNMAAMLQATERRLDDREEAALQAIASTTAARLSAVETRIQASEAERKKAEAGAHPQPQSTSLNPALVPTPHP